MGNPLKRLNWEEMAARLWLIRQKIDGQHRDHFCLELLLLAIAEGRLGGLVTRCGANLHEFLAKACKVMACSTELDNSEPSKPRSQQTAEYCIKILNLSVEEGRGDVPAGTPSQVQAFLKSLLRSTGHPMEEILGNIPHWSEDSLPTRELDALKGFLKPFANHLEQGLTATELLGRYLLWALAREAEGRLDGSALFLAIRAFVIAANAVGRPARLSDHQRLRLCSQSPRDYANGVSAFAEKLLKVKGV